MKCKLVIIIINIIEYCESCCREGKFTLLMLNHGQQASDCLTASVLQLMCWWVDLTLRVLASPAQVWPRHLLICIVFFVCWWVLTRMTFMLHFTDCGRWRQRNSDNINSVSAELIITLLRFARNWVNQLEKLLFDALNRNSTTFRETYLVPFLSHFVLAADFLYLFV